jgi:glycosyltransferase involved in cell wall biosynthesis
VQPDIIPWQDDTTLAALPLRAASGSGTVRVCVGGGIGIEKGYEQLLACARDAALRRLPLHFALVGYSWGDARLLDTGTVSITGPYRPDEAVALIRAQQADLGFLPSVWPETWSYVLSELWQAGLPVVAFDLGAPAERIRRSGSSAVLPLGLPAAAVNDALLAMARNPGGAGH